MRVNKDQIVCVAKLIGVEFHHAKIDVMLPHVNQALGSYEALRRVEIGRASSPRSTSLPAFPIARPSRDPSASKYPLAPHLQLMSNEEIKAASTSPPST
jgi:hypothetical protein